MAKRFKCIRKFSLECIDGDGFSIENQEIIVKKDSVWELEEEQEWTITGADLRLNTLDYDSWIEINNEDLKKDFVEIKL